MARRISMLELAVRRAAGVETSRRRAGLLAGKVTTFVMEWDLYRRERGDYPDSVEEWGAWACVSRATSFRRLHDFRRLFPEYATPTELLAVSVDVLAPSSAQVAV